MEKAGLPSRVERLEDWLQEPVEARCADDRFEIRRATPADYPAIFALLDRTFEDRRHRACDDWLYLRNPCGEARCWITVERGSGELVANETRWPWPFGRGAEAMRGELIGDTAVTPRLQRQDVGDLRAPFRQSHPWYADTTAISWPNESSRRSAIKHGYADHLFGPLPRAFLPLSVGGWLEARLPRMPRRVRSRLAKASDGMLNAWQRAVCGAPTLPIEHISRFDSTFDRVTQACMNHTEYWSPHSSDFLNWRYLDHPTHRYVAITAHADEPSGYAVLRFQARAAILMEFAAPTESDGCRASLLAAVRELACEAGCERIEFFSTAAWRHWRFLRRAGFVTWPSQHWVQARGPGDRPVSVWQLVPGDTDFL
jgi:hypothetical protein